MKIWEVDALSHWTVLDFYANQLEESNDLVERMIGLYLRDKANAFTEEQK